MVRQLERAESIIYPGELISTIGLLVDPLGDALQIADVTSWDVKVFEVGTFPGDERRSKRPIYSELAVNPGSANTNAGLPGTPLIISDTVRTDGFWDGPPPGYNFLHFIRPSDLSGFAPPASLTGGRMYLVEYAFTTVWDLVVAEHLLEARARRG